MQRSPNFMIWSLYNDCNFNCSYCPIPEELLKPKSAAFRRFYDLSFHDRLLSFFQKLFDYSGKWIICLSGGEPLLMPNLAHMVAGLTRIGHHVRYNTNLSVSIERDRTWLAANAPDKVDLLMVSIHNQTKIPELIERVRCLKALGYRLIVRAVCSLNKLHLIGDLDRTFKEVDVAFTPLPEYEFRTASAAGVEATPYPYTIEQRQVIIDYIKGFGELAMLYGGIDVTERLCGAGSRVLSLNTQSVQHLAQVSPCNTTTDYVMADAADFIEPSARPIETLLFSGSQPCFRANKKCDCPGLVEHNVIDGVPAWERYEQMANGYVSGLGERAADWIKENSVKFGEDMAEPTSTLPTMTAQPQLVEAIGTFNIVKFRGQFFGIPQSLGPLNLAEYDDLTRLPGMLAADNLQNARRMVRSRQRRSVDKLVSRMLLDCGHSDAIPRRRSPTLIRTTAR